MITQKLIILTGPSGSGKDEVMNNLVKQGLVNRVITHTSRSIRPGEIHGVDYHFVSQEKFEQLISEQYFLEYITYSGTYRGTAKNAIFPKDLPLIWRIDSGRAGRITETFNSVFPPETAAELLEKTQIIYLNVSDATTLHARIKQRDPNISETEIVTRFEEDRETWQKYQEIFQRNLIFNEDGELEKTIDQVRKRIGI